MAWGKNLSEINSTDINDLHEYNSRPTEKVLELISRISDVEIIIYGASGKWMSDLTEMILRSILETGTTKRKIHLVSRFRKKDEFEARFSKYHNLFTLHEIDLVKAKDLDLKNIPNDDPLVIYGVGYKFRTNETEEEYARLCKFYGNDIPKMIFEYHKDNSNIIVIGSANGIALSRVDNQANDDAPLVPKAGNLYGHSIRDKERILKETLKGNSSKAVILRGGYMTDFTYGGLEPIVFSVLNDKAIDIAKLTYFNIIGHRDANIYVILSADSASNPVTTLNLSGHTVDVRKVADMASKAFGKPAKIFGEPPKLHLLMSSSKIENLYGKPIDSLDNLINGQIYWIKNGGYSKALDHHVGESM